MPSSTNKEVRERRERLAELLVDHLSATAAIRVHVEREKIGRCTGYKDYNAVVAEWAAQGREKIEVLRSKALESRYRLLRRLLDEIDGCKHEVNRIAGYGTALKYLDSIAKLDGLLDEAREGPGNWTVTFRERLREVISPVQAKHIEVKDITLSDVKKNGSNGSNGTNGKH